VADECTYNLGTDIGKVRLHIQDTDVTDAKFTDAEIQAFLDAADQAVYGATGLALVTWATSLTSLDEMVQAGSWRGDSRDVSKKMLATADKYFQLNGGIPTDGSEWERVGMFGLTVEANDE
jgi:hypothetical protein